MTKHDPSLNVMKRLQEKKIFFYPRGQIKGGVGSIQ